MRYLVMMAVLVLAGCSSQWVRCERHLTPINQARSTPIAAAGIGWNEGDGPGRGATDSKSEGPPRTMPAGRVTP